MKDQRSKLDLIIKTFFSVPFESSVGKILKTSLFNIWSVYCNGIIIKLCRDSR